MSNTFHGFLFVLCLILPMIRAFAWKGESRGRHRLRAVAWMLSLVSLAFAPAAWSCGTEPAVSDPASWSAYKDWCSCMGGTVAADFNSAQAQGGCQFPSVWRPPVPPDPRRASLDNAVSRYDRLARSLANDNLVDGSWFALPRGTETEFLDTANRMHRFLVREATRSGAARKKLLDELAEANEVLESYPDRIANLNAENLKLGIESNFYDLALMRAQEELERTRRATKEIETRTFQYQEDVKRDQATILQWLTVFLPPAVVDAVSPRPYESIPILLVGAIRERERIPKKTKPLRLFPAAQAAVPLRPILPRLPPWTPEDAVTQLESDVLAWRAALHSDHGALASEVGRVRPMAAQLREQQRSAVADRDTLKSGIEGTATRLHEISSWTLLLAQDQLQSARETFVYRAADALIWKRAAAETKRVLRHEARRFLAAKTMRVADMTDENVLAYFETGRRNVFGISDQVLASGHALYPVVNRFHVLRTHAIGNVEEAIRLLSEGSPGEINAFIRSMFGQMHDDTKELMDASLGAAGVPEPWKSVYIKYLLPPR